MHEHSTLPKTMQAVVVLDDTHKTLALQSRPIPQITADEVLIKVHAAGVNRADLLQRYGHYPPPANASSILGLEVTGEVVAIGANVTDFKGGEHVLALVSGGGYSQYCAAHHALTKPLPPAWGSIKGAAIPEGLTTVHATVFMQGELRPHNHFLVHGAGSSIGSFAIQMARHHGAQVTTSVGIKDKMPMAQKIGANAVLCYKESNFFRQLEDETIDLVLDFIGGDYLAEHLRLLRMEGRLVQIACMQGPVATLSLTPILKKRLHIHGFTLRNQPLDKKIAFWQAAWAMWERALLDQHIEPIIDSVFSMDKVEEAHQRLKHAEHFGKIIVTF